MFEADSEEFSVSGLLPLLSSLSSPLLKEGSEVSTPFVVSVLLPFSAAPTPPGTTTILLQELKIFVSISPFSGTTRLSASAPGSGRASRSSGLFSLNT